MVTRAKISIVIPTYKHLDDCLKPCCESIIRNTDLSEVEVIVVANGCGNDGTREYVEGLPPAFKLVWFDEGLGYPKAVNAGVKESVGDYIVFLNNDVVLLDWQAKGDWLSRLCKPFEDPSVGITATLMMDSTFGEQFAHFALAATRFHVWEKVGPLDEIFGTGGGEDVDYCLKARKLGLKIVCVSMVKERLDNGASVTDFPMYHRGEATLLDDEHRAYYHLTHEKNVAILKERYGK